MSNNDTSLLLEIAANTRRTASVLSALAQHFGVVIQKIPEDGALEPVPEHLAPVVATNVVDAPETTKPTRRSSKSKNAPAPVSAEPSNITEVAEPTLDTPSEPTPPAAFSFGGPAIAPAAPVTLTLEQVNTELVAIATAPGGKDRVAKINALIKSYGVSALNQLPADKFADLLTKARNL